MYGPLAQLVEQQTLNLWVKGSIPLRLIDEYINIKCWKATARVVELADTLDLGSSTLGVRVQVPPLAFFLSLLTFWYRKRYIVMRVCESSSVVELHLAKVDVEGSNPFSRSKATN